jgi:hypothetical protein
MKRSALILLLLWSFHAYALEGQEGHGCRVLIEQNWIAMGASSLSACYKVAEAAASPGERQIAAFNATLIAYDNGRYFRSKDNGQTWLEVHLASGQRAITSLNVLQPDTAHPETELVPDEQPAAPPSPVEPPPANSASSAQPPPSVEKNADSQTSKTPVVIATQQDVPGSPEVATVAAPTGVQAVGAEMQGCQMNVGGKWQDYPTSSVETCGRRLISAIAKAGAKSGQGYWMGNYLYCEGNVLYQSRDGDHWQPLQ